MSTLYNYVAVIGRIPYDDEDSLYTFEHVTVEQARKAFADEMYALTYPESEREVERARCVQSHGCEHGVFINHVLVSESPIEEL